MNTLRLTALMCLATGGCIFAGAMFTCVVSFMRYAAGLTKGWSPLDFLPNAYKLLSYGVAGVILASIFTAIALSGLFVEKKVVEYRSRPLPVRLWLTTPSES